jgi:GT2 family glycosyltransferase
MLDLSVIVPTHNRKSFLPGLLESLAKQDYPAERWELVLVDDGSTDGTPEFLAAWQGPRPLNTRVITQVQSGVATTRNNGSALAFGKALLFLDDDMIASPTLVGEHARAHLEDPSAVAVGHLTLPTEGREAWIAWEDAQMHRHFDALKSGTRTPGPRDFYSGNCSVSRELFLRVGGYDTSLPRTEDVELGYRLQAAGANFYYRPAADSLHLGWHPFDRWLRNARLYGACDVTIGWEKDRPELRRAVFDWYRARRLPNRALVRLCSVVPSFERPIIGALHTAGRLSHKQGARRLSNACYSAIYNLVYWLALIEALGPDRFWRGIRLASDRSGEEDAAPAPTTPLPLKADR